MCVATSSPFCFALQLSRRPSHCTAGCIRRSCPQIGLTGSNTCFCDNEERVMKLTICILGSNHYRACEMLRILCENNPEEIAVFHKRQGRAVLRDGTVLIAQSVSDRRCLDGLRFDQVFFESYSPTGWRDIENPPRMVQWLSKSMLKSRVPTEFQWCHIDR